MMIVITQKKVVEATTMISLKPLTPPDVMELIDQVGALQTDAEATAKKIKALQTHLKPYADKVKCLTELVSKYAMDNGIDPDKEFTTATNDFVLRVGKAGTQRTVADVELAMKKIGRKLFFQKCVIGLGVIDQYLTPEQKQRVLKVERCSRGIKVLRRVNGQGNG
jgi:hypothetical protein